MRRHAVTGARKPGDEPRQAGTCQGEALPCGHTRVNGTLEFSLAWTRDVIHFNVNVPEVHALCVRAAANLRNAHAPFSTRIHGCSSSRLGVCWRFCRCSGAIYSEWFCRSVMTRYLGPHMCASSRTVISPVHNASNRSSAHLHCTMQGCLSFTQSHVVLFVELRRLTPSSTVVASDTTAERFRLPVRQVTLKVE